MRGRLVAPCALSGVVACRPHRYQLGEFAVRGSYVERKIPWFCDRVETVKESKRTDGGTCRVRPQGRHPVTAVVPGGWCRWVRQTRTPARSGFPDLPVRSASLVALKPGRVPRRSAPRACAFPAGETPEALKNVAWMGR